MNEIINIPMISDKMYDGYFIAVVNKPILKCSKHV